MKTLAPAKINWTLEVLGRRDDGYHEIRSVMQTIDLCDEITAERSEAPVFETVRGEPLAEEDLIVRAARALEQRVGRLLPATIRVEKRIPGASGLGGGSSDAAATIRLLGQLHDLNLSPLDAAEVAGCSGSDVLFLVHGGTALVEGRGERVTALPDVREAWLVVLAPPIKMADKTKRMYEALSTEDFSDGSQTDVLARGLQGGVAVHSEDLCNTFERVAFRVFDGLEAYREALLSAGAQRVHLAGAGPALFALAASEEAARELADLVQAPEAKVFVARTLGAAEATLIVQ